MGYFDDKQNVENYLQMSEGYDGKLLIDVLMAKRPKGGTLLELGMGPGKDTDLLSPFFNVLGSDTSQHFLDLYQAKNPEAKVIKLDAQTIETDQTFDVIYSNKVLHQLSPESLVASFVSQAKRLNKDGLALHSFWAGTDSETFDGDTYFYYQPADIETLLPENALIEDHAFYAEMEENDSFWALVSFDN
jgi:hypothetical protein